MNFLAYPEYKPSGLDWLEEVPAHWENRKIARDIPFVVGWTPSSGKDEYYDGDFPWVTIADMTQMFVKDTKSKISRLAVQERGAKVVPAGSMLFSFKLTVGKIAFLATDSYTNEAIAGFFPDGKFDLEYWKYAAPEFIPRYGRENIYGATLLNQELIGSVRFYAPVREEQTKIAGFLDHETARIDELIEEQKRLIGLLKEKRQAVISQAVTKGIDPTVPMKDSGVEWLGEVPAHWHVTKLGWVLNELTYGFTNPMPTEDLGPVMLTANDIGWGVVLYDQARSTSEFAFKEMLTDKSRPRAGDLLLTKDGTLGRVAVHDGRPACINQSVALLRPDYRFLKSDFLCGLIQASRYQAKMIFDAGGTTIKHIYITILAKMNVAIPPLDEQKALLNYMNEEIGRFDRLTSKAEQVVVLLQERRSALISAAVTGKIDVRGWQPSVSAPTPELVQEAV